MEPSNEATARTTVVVHKEFQDFLQTAVARVRHCSPTFDHNVMIPQRCLFMSCFQIVLIINSVTDTSNMNLWPVARIRNAVHAKEDISN
jgi:hypothetical protein